MTPEQATKLSQDPRRARSYLLASEAHNEALQRDLDAARRWLEIIAVAYVDLLARDLIDPDTAEVRRVLERIADEG